MKNRLCKPNVNHSFYSREGKIWYRKAQAQFVLAFVLTAFVAELVTHLFRSFSISNRLDIEGIYLNIQQESFYI